MTSIPLGRTDWKRATADEPIVSLKNRYFEENPTNMVEQTALLSRPGLQKFLDVGSGPIRAIYCQPGSFNDALFVVAYDSLYRISVDETVTFLSADIAGADIEGNSPSLAATAQIGAVPEYLYIADGEKLLLYDGATVTTVATPDDIGIISVAVIASYIIAVCSPGEGYNGRFYWIEPAETTIDPINFATAERTPDTVVSVRVVGDQFWLLGLNSTEVWYPTGDFDTPFVRTQGRVFDRGVWEGSDVQIKDSVMLVDNDGVVYQIINGAPQRVSNNAMEERIRKAIRTEIIG